MGRVVQVIGPVLDVEFEPEHLPEIYNALKIEDSSGGFPVRLTGEVQQHLGQNQVRAVAMGTTDGLIRGMKVTDTGGPITVPVGNATLGRFQRARRAGRRRAAGARRTERWPIHREPPKFTDLEPKTEVFETGIKVIDLLTPFVRGGKAGLFGGAGLGKTVILQELIATSPRSTAATRCSAASASGPARGTTSGSRCRKRRSWRTWP